MNLIRHIRSIFYQSKRKQTLEQLEWQRYLLHSGIPATVQVMEISVKKSGVPGFVVAEMWVKSKQQENLPVHRIHSQLNKKMLPQKDQVIHIKFLPEDASQVVVLQYPS